MKGFGETIEIPNNGFNRRQRVSIEGEYVLRVIILWGETIDLEDDDIIRERTSLEEITFVAWACICSLLSIKRLTRAVKGLWSLPA